MVICYINDILITGKDTSKHFEHLEEVMNRLRDNGVSVKKSKCEFFKDSVEYLGHVVDEAGLPTSPRKVEAIVKAPRSKIKQELRVFLGMIHYYRKFVPTLLHH